MVYGCPEVPQIFVGRVGRNTPAFEKVLLDHGWRDFAAHQITPFFYPTAT
jgi:hypothetical protein